MFVSASKGESSDISSCEEDKEVLIKKTADRTLLSDGRAGKS